MSWPQQSADKLKYEYWAETIDYDEAVTEGWFYGWGWRMGQEPSGRESLSSK